MARRIITCSRCNRENQPHAAGGLCNRCYQADPARVEKGRERALKWYRSHKEQSYSKEKARLATLEGRSVKNKARRKRYAKNPYIIRQQVSNWGRRNTSSRNIRIYRHQLRKLNVTGSHTASEWEDRKAEFNYTCAYCLKPDNILTKDHMTPVSWGPLSSDNIDNIVPACRSCNSSKSGLNILLYLLYR